MDVTLRTLLIGLLAVGARGQDQEPTCTSPGELFPDEINCNQFWLCNTELVPYLYDCPTGQYWDTSLNTCNPVEQVECGARSTVTSTEATTAAPTAATTSSGTIVCTAPGQLFPDATDCTAFWLCNTELVPYEYYCPTGQYWDDTVSTCNPAQTVSCGSRSTPTSTAAPATSTASGAIICTSAGQLFTDPDDCSSFYMCDTNLVPYLYTCQNGEYWDSTAMSCNPIQTVSCGSRPTPSPSPTSTAAVTPVGYPTCTASGQLYPDAANCSGFWFCDTNLVPYLFYCANGEYYDETLSSCDPQETVSCGTRSTASTSGGGATTTTQASRTPAPTQTCGYVSQLIPDCDDCGAFFECNALLQPVYFDCPAGEYFSISDNDCQDSGNVDCVDGARPDYDLCP